MYISAFSGTLSVTNDVSGLKEGLVDDLEDVARWVETNKLKLNGQKTQMLLLSRKRRAQELEHDRDEWPGNIKEQVCKVSGNVVG